MCAETATNHLNMQSTKPVTPGSASDACHWRLLMCSEANWACRLFFVSPSRSGELNPGCATRQWRSVTTRCDHQQDTNYDSKRQSDVCQPESTMVRNRSVSVGERIRAARLSKWIRAAILPQPVRRSRGVADPEREIG